MSKPGFVIFYTANGEAATILSVTDGRGEGERARLVLADDRGISEVPLSEHDLRWLVSELLERVPVEGREPTKEPVA
ncbi:MAG TPA: hypothetical protein VGY48_15520 [Vicinamibacterales bacterium]|jgi:hypothetical protein|nr:hypothetical protein [Vicinamibacterales bacterium]